MAQQRVDAVFMRGGTSRGIFFQRAWLPEAQEDWAPIFLGALGSPDPYGRQLDGLGGGVSSLSKIVVVEPSARPDADVEYTFGQVAVREAAVAYRTNCGNLTSAVGPFAVDEGLVTPSTDASGSEAAVRLYNVNTRKRIVARFPLDGGSAAVEGDFELLGVAGQGAPIRLEFQDPGGAVTGELLPGGAPAETLAVPGLGELRVSIVDATTAVVAVNAADLGLQGSELPDAIEADAALLARLEAVRGAAALRLGLSPSVEEARACSPQSPLIAIVAAPQAASTLAGEAIDPAAVDLTARVMSMGQAHRALPLTAAMCLAVAARIEGSVVHELTRPGDPAADLRLGNPSGVLPVAASVRREGGGEEHWVADDVVVYRTARRLMEGRVLVPASRLAGREAAAAAGAAR